MLLYKPIVIDHGGAEARVEISSWKNATIKDGGTILTTKPDIVISIGKNQKLHNPQGHTARQLVDAVCRLIEEVDGNVYPPYLDFIDLGDDRRILVSLSMTPYDKKKK